MSFRDAKCLCEKAREQKQTHKKYKRKKNETNAH